MSAPVVFVVDDEAPVRLSLRVLLRAEGFAVQDFGSAAEALEAAKRDTPDCVLTDFHMPGMNGRELIEQLERVHSDITFVLMTGRDDPGRLLRTDGVPVIAKPFDAGALLALLREVMSTSSHR